MNAMEELNRRIDSAIERYGEFASTHEALGVAIEEWDEFRDAVRSNDLQQVKHECFDLAAVLIRLAISLGSKSTSSRSVK